MHIFFVSIILACIITLMSSFVKRSESEKPVMISIKIFLISIATIFLGCYFLLNLGDSYPEIEVGEADF